MSKLTNAEFSHTCRTLIACATSSRMTDAEIIRSLRHATGDAGIELSKQMIGQMIHAVEQRRKTFDVLSADPQWQGEVHYYCIFKPRRAAAND